MTSYKVTLSQKITTIRLAESASEAVEQAMADVAEQDTKFVPSTWSVKEQVEKE